MALVTAPDFPQMEHDAFKGVIVRLGAYDDAAECMISPKKRM